MIVFAILNFVENLIHYNIGIERTNNYNNKRNNKFKLYFPNFHDFLKIITTMFIFSLAQGILTELLIKD